MSAVVSEPGVIRHTALGRIVVGPLDGQRHPVLEQLVEAGNRSGFDATLSDRIEVDIWSKFARLTVLSGMTTLARSPIGVVRDDPELFAMMEAALRESIAVAHGKQVPLPQNIFAEIVASMATLPPKTKSSMLEDLERGRPLELPWLSGAVVRIGREVGVDTPTHRLIVALLAPHVHGTRG